MHASGPKLTRRKRRLLSLALLAGLALLIVFLDAGQAERAVNDLSDKRNLTHGEKNGGNPSLDCWSHHRGEGMHDSHVVLPIFPVQVLPNTEDVYKVQVVNSWKYDLSELLVQFTLKGNETLIEPTQARVAEPQQNLYQTWRGTLGNDQLRSRGVDVPPSKAVLNFSVAPLPTALTARLELHFKEPAQPPAGSAVDNNHLTSGLFPPGSKRSNFKFNPPEDTARERNLAMNPKDLQSGLWRFELFFENGGAGGVGTPTVDYFLNVTVLYGSQAGQTYDVYFSPRTPDPKDPYEPIPILRPGQVQTIDVPVRHLGLGTQEIDVHVRALLWYRHKDGKTPDEDYFNRYATVKVTVGTQRIESTVQGATAATVGVDARLVAGEVSGFSAGFLLLPSLLFGGTYGKASRKFFNRVLGGAKRRVMYHNLLSLGLTVVAAAHVVLFMLEIRYTVLMGVLWGGLGTVSLLVLGLSGYYQVPLIQKYGYNWWRYTHLAFGILVVAFVAWHSIVDGPDFDFIKKTWPQSVQDWLQNNFNLAYK